MTVLARVLLSLLLVVFSTANLTPSAAKPNPPHFVYRADFREPLSIFHTGMLSYGTCENVFYHIQGKNCKQKTSAFVSTTSSEQEAMNIVKIKLAGDSTKDKIYVYKIRADPRFYSAIYSLMTAADKYSIAGKQQDALKYRQLAEKYKSQEEWMAYKEIPSTLIQLAITYPRNLVNLNKKGAVVTNARYADANSFASQQPFPESMKGCPPLEQLKACLLG